MLHQEKYTRKKLAHKKGRKSACVIEGESRSRRKQRVQCINIEHALNGGIPTHLGYLLLLAMNGIIIPDASTGGV